MPILSRLQSAKMSLAMLVLPFALVGCGGGDTRVATSPATDVDSGLTVSGTTVVGDVSTVEISGVILSSLPETSLTSSVERVELGRLLFWDPILSGDRDVACATCHLPEFGYTDGRDRSIGVGGVGSGPSRAVGHTGTVPRNAPSILNTVWNGIDEFGLFNPKQAPMFWDNRVQGLENQALEPLRSEQEMRGNNFTVDELDVEIVNRLAAIPDYQTRFQSIYGAVAITQELVGDALADYQRTLIANNSPFDRWVRGDSNAMSMAQIEGMSEFVQVGCASCHSGPMFSDFETHVLGVEEANGLQVPDSGDGSFAFRTPTLRQLNFTSPYFHGGQSATLSEAIEFYDRPSRSQNPNVSTNELDSEFLSTPSVNGERAIRIEQFLNALNDPNFDRTRPATVPSGLPVGGLIE